MKLLYAIALQCLFIAVPLCAELRQQECNALQQRVFNDTTINSTAWLRLDNTEVCVVTGQRWPFLDIEVTLPSQWSGRYLQQGGSGIDGHILSGVQRNEKGVAVGLSAAITQHGAVFASSNGGHRLHVPEQAGPALWTRKTAEAEASFRHFSYLALGHTLHFAHSLIDEVYARKPAHSYFNGSSNGGRHAYVVAERWPQYFDGIVAGKATMNLEGTAVLWMKMAQTIGSASELSVSEYRFAYEAALSHCDADDGAEDGILQQPYQCNFAPEKLLCGTNQTKDCLSAAQVNTLNVLLSDLVDSSGQIVSSAFPWTDFSEFAPAFSAYAALSGLIATGDARWLTPEGIASFDEQRDRYKIIANIRKSGSGHDVIGVADYVAQGGKLLSWHPGSDNLHPLKDHQRMFSNMLTIARAHALDSSNEPVNRAKFFVIPGAKHGDGSYPEVDWISAIIDWVEKDKQPQDMTYSKIDEPSKTKLKPWHPSQLKNPVDEQKQH